MIVMVCVDNQNGMMFNHRRQSQDRGLRRRMCEIAGNDDGKFWMNAYSRKMFTDSDTEGTHAQLCVAEDFMKQAASGDFCLLETERSGRLCSKPRRTDSVQLEPGLSGGSAFYTGSERMETSGDSRIRRLFAREDHRNTLHSIKIRRSQECKTQSDSFLLKAVSY